MSGCQVLDFFSEYFFLRWGLAGLHISFTHTEVFFLDMNGQSSASLQLLTVDYFPSSLLPGVVVGGCLAVTLVLVLWRSSLNINKNLFTDRVVGH